MTEAEEFIPYDQAVDWIVERLPNIVADKWLLALIRNEKVRARARSRLIDRNVDWGSQHDVSLLDVRRAVDRLTTVSPESGDRDATLVYSVNAAGPVGQTKPDAMPQTGNRTGLAGRPTSWHLIEAECRHRFAAGERYSKTVEWAKVLQKWLPSAHPEAPPPQLKTLTNKLTPLLRELRNGKAPKTP
jgi:hypothetical protein